MNKETQSEPELSLQPKEKVLWESAGGVKGPDTVAWVSLGFWILVFVIFTAILSSLLFESLQMPGISGQSFYLGAGILGSITALLLLGKQVIKEINRETEMNYAITNQRLVVANKSGTHHKSFTGRPFSSLSIQRKSETFDIDLHGITADTDEVIVQLLGVKDGPEAEKLLLKSFMQKPGAQK